MRIDLKEHKIAKESIQQLVDDSKALDGLEPSSIRVDKESYKYWCNLYHEMVITYQGKIFKRVEIPFRYSCKGCDRKSYGVIQLIEDDK